MKTFTALTLVASFFVTGHAAADSLNVSLYNPGEEGIFPVTSVLVSGEKEAILFDAQFSVKDGEALVDKIKKSGKTLTMIYISGGDPDFYFGLQPLKQAFPHVEIVASQSVVDHIQETKADKLAYWGPILGEYAPTTIVVPTVMDDTTLTLEGKQIEVKEINTHQAYLWLPSAKTVFGGVSVTAGMHVWTADSQSKTARKTWIESLDRMTALQPERVIPGHYLGDVPLKTDAISFTRDYLTTFEQALSEFSVSGKVIDTMKMHYPLLPGESDLALSAKVNTGEMEW